LAAQTVLDQALRLLRKSGFDMAEKERSSIDRAVVSVQELLKGEDLLALGTAVWTLERTVQLCSGAAKTNLAKKPMLQPAGKR
jgi:hypothetical protein